MTIEMEAPVRPASPTERKIAEMLLENTGSHFLDSGGVYGRAWQHTRAKYGLNPSKNSSFSGGPLGPDPDPSKDEIERIARAMRDEPWVAFDGYSISLNTFHFLTDALEYVPELDRKFQRWCEVTNYGKDRYDKDWGLPLMERFAEQIQARGLYGDGPFFTENSYNGECALDRTIQFTLMTVGPSDESGRWVGDEWVEPREPFLPEETYILLQIHGGADVRGGYTQPVLFRASGMGEYAILDYARVSLRCGDGHSWDSENGGYTFNLDGMWGRNETVMSFDSYETGKGRIKPIDISLSSTPRWLCPIDGSRLLDLNA